MKKTISALSVATLLTTLAMPALAQQQNCAPQTAMETRLNDQFGESRQVAGEAPDNTVIEVFASDNTGTWSITVTYPTGTSCMIAAGDGFTREVEVEPKPTPQLPSVSDVIG